MTQKIDESLTPLEKQNLTAHNVGRKRVSSDENTNANITINTTITEDETKIRENDENDVIMRTNANNNNNNEMKSNDNNNPLETTTHLTSSPIDTATAAATSSNEGIRLPSNTPDDQLICTNASTIAGSRKEKTPNFLHPSPINTIPNFRRSHATNPSLLSVHEKYTNNPCLNPRYAFMCLMMH